MEIRLLLVWDSIEMLLLQLKFWCCLKFFWNTTKIIFSQYLLPWSLSPANIVSCHWPYWLQWNLLENSVEAAVCGVVSRFVEAPPAVCTCLCLKEPVWVIFRDWQTSWFLWAAWSRCGWGGRQLWFYQVDVCMRGSSDLRISVEIMSHCLLLLIP